MNQKSSPASRVLVLRAGAAKRVSWSTAGVPAASSPRRTNASLGPVSEERVNARRPFGRGWIEETAPEEVSSRGALNEESRVGSVVEAEGVGGTGSEKILIRAMSAAVKKTVLSSCANYQGVRRCGECARG